MMILPLRQVAGDTLVFSAAADARALAQQTAAGQGATNNNNVKRDEIAASAGKLEKGE